MSEDQGKKGKGCLIAAVLWCLIIGLIGAAYKYFVHPHLSGKLKEATSSSSQYKDEIVIAADSFSGYCVLRSDLFKQELKTHQIKATIADDKADYDARLQALREGTVQMAVFTIDSLIAAGAKAGDFPGTIVMVIDETKGGDAMVAYKSAVGSVQDLNHGNARVVLTANSPSEFMARVVLAHFHLPNISEKWKVEADGAAAVFKAFRAAGPTEKKAFVLWEPYVSKALEQKGVHILIDSSKLKGLVVDVLVAQRAFLRDHPDVVKRVVESYARAAYTYAQQPDGMLKLVMEDSQKTGGESLNEALGRKVVQGIQWKNTLENYAHFGLAQGGERGGLANIEDMIGNVVDVLVKTKAIASDPLAGSYNTLYYDKILAEMKQAGFHPGLNQPLLEEPFGSAESIQSEKELPALSEQQWSSLRPVGELRIAPIEFGRGSATITLDGERELQGLARRLQSFPQFYLRVIGHARADGDLEANRALAQSRAEAATQYLTGQGLAPSRVRSESAAPAVQDGAAQSVSFVVGQVPF